MRLAFVKHALSIDCASVAYYLVVSESFGLRYPAPTICFLDLGKIDFVGPQCYSHCKLRTLSGDMAGTAKKQSMQGWTR